MPSKRVASLSFLLLLLISAVQLCAALPSDYFYTTYVTGHTTTASDFEGDLSDWVKSAGGTKAADAVNFKDGVQGMKLTSPTSATNVFATKNLASTDFRNKYIKIWVYLYDYANLNELSIYIASDSGFTKFASTNLINYATTLRLATGWNELAIPISSACWTATGDTLSNIASAVIRLRLRQTAKTASANDVTFDNCLLVDNPYAGAITITFDDNRDNVYTTAKTHLDEYNYKAVIFVAPSVQVGGAGYNNETVLAELYADGWDIASHGSHEDFTTLSVEDLTSALVDSQNWLLAREYYRGAWFIAAPYHGWDAAISATVDDYYRFMRCRSSGNLPETNVPLNPDNLRAHTIIHTTTLAAVKKFVDDAKLYNTWSILTFHNIVTTADESSEWSTANFSDLLDYINAEGVRVVTISERYAELADGLDCTITAIDNQYGTLSPTGAVAVNSGDSQVFTFTGDDTFTVDDISINGVSMGRADTYTFDYIAGNLTITASFYQSIDEMLDYGVIYDSVNLLAVSMLALGAVVILGVTKGELSLEMVILLTGYSIAVILVTYVLSGVQLALS